MEETNDMGASQGTQYRARPEMSGALTFSL